MRLDDDVTIRAFARADTEPVIALWADAFPNYSDASVPHRDPRRSIEAKLAVQPELFFVALRGARLTGTVMAGYDGHRGWLYSFAVAREARRLGIGRALMAHAEAALATLGCRKINLQVLAENDEACRFYAALGYQVEQLVSFGKRLPMSA
ncbi:GNAT family acetyltransferase [Burkholderia glumae]|uniref:GNAT family acetyltransferase n=1 Tax=Burkholderia glumae TaxID=337 RepID=A0AAP9Y138_BURGL|nr:GNAT family acetyltransferase [Burkholderia glumae]ACR29923.1 Acetyltransferase, GNAT family [Burkholderia glumae BGR1]KHJ63716.1 acetyltransferase [Burkholderia glumae]MCM2482452.1 GNAT family acetyltransferase [Burkholderia glumae]MCM2490957.1 GNAT family acetyltransferase [Burkholderia glumae]MCM2507404.1 GNAT family acetyltransferase [Burkholderia glumae]